MTLYQGSQARRSDPCKKRSQVGSCKLTIATALVCCVSVRVYVCVCVCVCFLPTFYESLCLVRSESWEATKLLGCFVMTDSFLKQTNSWTAEPKPPYRNTTSVPTHQGVLAYSHP